MLCKCIFIICTPTRCSPPHQISPEIRESVAKAARKLRYLNQALLSQTATLGSGRWIKSHVFNVRPLMKGCDSFIVKWQGPPRKLAKEVFVKFILAKEKIRSRKSGERFWRKTMWLEQNHTRFSTQLRWSLWWSRCFKSWFRTDFSELHPVKKYSQPCVPNTSNTKSIALFMIHHGQDPSRMMIFVWRWVALWLWLPMLEELGHQLVTSPPLCYTSAGRCLLWCGVEGSGILSVA